MKGGVWRMQADSGSSALRQSQEYNQRCEIASEDQRATVKDPACEEGVCTTVIYAWSKGCHLSHGR